MSAARFTLLGAALGVASIGPGCAAADDTLVAATLPPIVTTSTTSTTVLVDTTVVRFYKVQPGDTLSKIADSFKVREQDLMTLNGITNADHIEIGQELEIPSGKVVIDSLPPTPGGANTTSSG
jgi:LysM repeat protein